MHKKMVQIPNFFQYFILKIYFVPLRWPLLPHLNFQKRCQPDVFCNFLLANILRTISVCTFSTSQLQKSTSELTLSDTFYFNMRFVRKQPCGVISGPCFVQKSWFRTAQAIQNSRKMCSKNQWISDVKVLKTCVLAHSVCICWLSGFVSWAWRTHNSLVKTNVLRRHVFFCLSCHWFLFRRRFFLCAVRTHLCTVVCLFEWTSQCY